MLKRKNYLTTFIIFIAWPILNKFQLKISFSQFAFTTKPRHGAFKAWQHNMNHWHTPDSDYIKQYQQLSSFFFENKKYIYILWENSEIINKLFQCLKSCLKFVKIFWKWPWINIRIFAAIFHILCFSRSDESNNHEKLQDLFQWVITLKVNTIKNSTLDEVLLISVIFKKRIFVFTF